MQRGLLLMPIMALAMLGCAGTNEQQVTPVASLAKSGKEICIVHNPRVRESFLQAYRNALVKKGYEIRLLPESAQWTTCPLTSRYSALWSMDLFLHLMYAEIQVFRDGKSAGRAVYNAGQGTSKFINAEEKIQELVKELFPN